MEKLMKKKQVERELKKFDETGFASVYGKTDSVADWYLDDRSDSLSLFVLLSPKHNVQIVFVL